MVVGSTDTSVRIVGPRMMPAARYPITGGILMRENMMEHVPAIRSINVRSNNSLLT